MVKMVSIIIPTLNEEKFIGPTLNSLGELTAIDHEIIVSDSGSADKTVAIAQNHTGVKVTTTGKKGGISLGKNTGARAATGDYLVFIDADVLIPKPNDFFKKLLGVFLNDPKLVALTVPIKVSPESATLADEFFFGLLNGLYVFMNNFIRVGSASGEFQMIRAAEFKTLNGYREDLPAGEDNDMFLRLSKIGKTMSYTKLCVYHSGRRAHIVGWPKLFSIWLKNGIYIFLFKKSAVKEWEPLR